jgi:hypothetical protein
LAKTFQQDHIASFSEVLDTICKKGRDCKYEKAHDDTKPPEIIVISNKIIKNYRLINDEDKMKISS